MIDRAFIRCSDISYRQGFIEVRGDIHPSHVNLEVWNIDSDLDISCLNGSDDKLCDGVVRNTEIELSIVQASALIEALQAAISVAQAQ